MTSQIGCGMTIWASRKDIRGSVRRPNSGMYWLIVAYISMVSYLNWLFSILIHWGSSIQWEISASLSFSVSWPPEERRLIRLAQTAIREQARSSACDVAGTSICFAAGVEEVSMGNEDLEPFPSPSELLRKHLEPRLSERWLFCSGLISVISMV